MSNDIKYMDIKEFRESGYLQELNRRFLHPLGLAMEVTINENGTEQLGGVWDYRDDAEGIMYGESMVCDNTFKRKVSFIEESLKIREKTRKELLGFFIQPVGK